MSETNSASRWENLANAIIERAAVDYQQALKALKKRPTDIYAQREIIECRRFFRSDYFRSLTSIDGEWLMKQIEKAPDIDRTLRKYRNYL